MNNKLILMFKSGYCPPPDKMDKKTAQFFVCQMYLRYRLNRFRFNKSKRFGDKVDCDYFFGLVNENWNALQIFKKFYYNIK